MHRKNVFNSEHIYGRFEVQEKEDITLVVQSQGELIYTKIGSVGEFASFGKNDAYFDICMTNDNEGMYIDHSNI